MTLISKLTFSILNVVSGAEPAECGQTSLVHRPHRKTSDLGTLILQICSAVIEVH